MSYSFSLSVCQLVTGVQEGLHGSVLCPQIQTNQT